MLDRIAFPPGTERSVARAICHSTTRIHGDNESWSAGTEKSLPTNEGGD
jgi:hypothetical protein